jgi:hypothetical protein
MKKPGINAYRKFNTDTVKKILKAEKDFNKALDMVISFLEGVEPWRSDRPYFISIVEILKLKNYHQSVWRC